MPYGPATQFQVMGKPVPKARPRVGPNGNVYTPKETEAYEEKVGLYARAAKVPLVKRPRRVALQLAVFLKNPLVGDADNYVKSVMDGLNGVAYEDDCQVTVLKVLKLRANQTEPRVSVIVQEVL